jgi:exosome complex RNA-binding protein Csl4
MKRNYVHAYPGDYLAVIEEFEPLGDYFIKDGEIIASKVSEIKKDKSKKQIFINGLVRKYVKIGDIVIGKVDYMQKPFAHVIIFMFNDKKLPGDLKAMFYYDPDLNLVPFNEGAIIRAKIVSITAGHLMIDIQDNEMGVLESWCPYCGGPLIKKGRNMVRCLKCGKNSFMKLAPDFYSSRAKHINYSNIF